MKTKLYGTKMKSLTYLSLILLLSACGTIIHGTTQQIGFTSSPSKAVVSINGQESGTTPLILDLERKNNHIISIELDGYEEYETTLTRKVSGWVWGNIVFGGLIGLVVDASTGGMYELTPEQLEADLKNKNISYADTDKGLYIGVVLEAKPNWKKIGDLEKSK